MVGSFNYLSVWFKYQNIIHPWMFHFLQIMTHGSLSLDYTYIYMSHILSIYIYMSYVVITGSYLWLLLLLLLVLIVVCDSDHCHYHGYCQMNHSWRDFLEGEAASNASSLFAGTWCVARWGASKAIDLKWFKYTSTVYHIYIYIIYIWINIWDAVKISVDYFSKGGSSCVEKVHQTM